MDFSLPRYFVPICIRHQHGFYGGPAGYQEMTKAMARAWSPIIQRTSVRFIDKFQAVLRRTLEEMINFNGGPAGGATLELRRAPLFLRVVIDESDNVDALDQLADKPRPNETVYVYRRTRHDGTMFLCGRSHGRGCRVTAVATYEYYLPVFQEEPVDFRDTTEWRAWCEAQDPETKTEKTT